MAIFWLFLAICTALAIRIVGEGRGFVLIFHRFICEFFKAYGARII
jgi:hypothetical protein